MNEQEKMEIFFDIFDPSLPRLGPADDASTLKALGIVMERLSSHGLPGSDGLRILDLGCGNGGQTLQLAKHAGGTILAIDNHEPFLEELVRRARREGVDGSIRIQLTDMNELELEDESFEIVWSEGALFAMGFREGLKECRRLLVPGGCLAVTELCWIEPDVPQECRDFFEAPYPAITGIEENLAFLREAGCEVVEHFTLPDSAWSEVYCRPLGERINVIREKYARDDAKLQFVESIEREIDIRERYGRYYGYEFFIGQRD